VLHLLQCNIDKERSSSAVEEVPESAGAKQRKNVAVQQWSGPQAVLAEQGEQVRAVHAGAARGFARVAAARVDERAQVLGLESMEGAGARLAVAGVLARIV